MQDLLIIARYGEIGIKSPVVRRRFERRLISNIKTVIDCKVELNNARIFLYPEVEDLEKTIDSLQKIFGIVSFSPAVLTRTDYDSIEETIKDYLKEQVPQDLFSPGNSFAIRARRVGEHDFTSQEMAAFCGSVVVGITGAPVDLSNPDFELFVEVRGDKTYVFHEKIPGLGGLPVGTQGKVIALVSGGIDSPVATFLMMKRGCSVTMVNFNNHPYTSGSSAKILQLHQKLKEYSAGSRLDLYQVEYGPFLEKCIEEAPPRMTCVLCKSGMYQIAEKIAREEKALAIVDGSSLGQVASQTLPNILATRYSTSIPVLSPLIGLDKAEIENMGKKIGTYDLSILPEEGCSAAPRHPETNAELPLIMETLEDIDADEELEKTLNSIKLLK